MSIVPSVVGSPKKTASLVQSVDQLLKKNQQLLRENRYAFVRNNLVNSHIPVSDVQILDYLSEENQQLQKENQQRLGDVAAVRKKLVGPSEAPTKVKAENASAKIATWLFYAIGSA